MDTPVGLLSMHEVITLKHLQDTYGSGLFSLHENVVELLHRQRLCLFIGLQI